MIRMCHATRDDDLLLSALLVSQDNISDSPSSTDSVSSLKKPDSIKLIFIR
jgi:hypothetical protein